MGKERLVGAALLAVMLVLCILHLALAPSLTTGRWILVTLFVGWALFMVFAKRG